MSTVCLRTNRLYRDAGLPAPGFELRVGSFVLTLWRDWLTDEVLAGLNLNQRQLKTLAHLKIHGRITNRECQELTGASERTALRDLGSLEGRGVVQRIGMTGRNAYYVVAGKPTINPTNPPAQRARWGQKGDNGDIAPLPTSPAKGAMNGPNGPSGDQSSRRGNAP